MTILPNWRSTATPFNIPLPNDPPPKPGVNWQAAYDSGATQEHFDWMDSLRNRKWYTDNPGEAGGSMIQFGYACEDLDAVQVAIKAFGNSVEPDDEHLIRYLVYFMGLYDMTGNARPLVTFMSRRLWPLSVLDDMMRQVQAAPNTGLMVNPRAFGWQMYGRAAQMKAARTSSTWAQKALDLLELAAMPSGQPTIDTRLGINETSLFYAFQTSILAIGAASCAYRLGEVIPEWIIRYALNLYEMPTMTAAGWPTMPSFIYTKGSRFKVCTGPGQQPCPGGAYWSALCVVLDKMDPNGRWIDKAYRFGCGTSQNDAQERRDSMLLRGALQ